jgi:hypothetical protein
VPQATENVDALRQGWFDAVTTLAPDVASVREQLDAGLSSAEREQQLNESTLLAVIDDAMREGGSELTQETGQALVRRLQRGVYEYLLSLDAAKPDEMALWPGESPVHGEGAMLIGAEEVAALRSEPAAGPPPAEVAPEPTAEVEEAAPAEEHAPSDTYEPPAAEAADAEAADQEAAARSEPAPVADAADQPLPDAGAEPEPEGTGEGAPGVDEAAPADKPQRRFAIFGRTSAGRAPERPGPTPTTEYEFEQRAAQPSEESFTPLPANQGSAGEPFIAPREGFHIREEATPFVISTPSDLGNAFHEAPPRTPAAAQAGQRSGTPETEAHSPGWSVRGEGTAGASARAGVAPDSSVTPSRAEEQEEAFVSPAVLEARKKIEDRLNRRRCDEAAALVQKLAQEPGGRAVAELGLDAGDRCRALGKNNSALSCYLAATRADPVFHEPLLRLADICLDDHDIDLAVAYLERVARFHRMAGDHKAALRIFRKIATIAPYREDILSLLVRMQATGRFDD